ncbi:general transcription factor II-I repeat domain-containing protein 2-like [Centruroides vittatus]|uniref:general transcription factor II-I repeat domain-containing protein 2-like n=1 Tax=Centruroides vittatus TaxID=120091 RepID=UPI0035105051
MSVVKKIKTNDTSSRPYQTEWFDKYGVIEKNKTTLCVICNEKVTSRTYNVKRHFEKLHSSLSLSTDEERRIYFLQKKKENHSQTSVLETVLIPKNNIIAASFQFAHCISRQGKPLSEGEFVKQAFLECSATLFADFKEKDLIIKRINELPITRNTIKDRVIELERNIFSQIHNDLNYAEMYSIALDESNDVNGYAQLAVFAPYKSYNIMQEELMKLVTLKGKCTGLDIFKEFNIAFKEMDIDLQKIVSVTTDSAPNVVGKTLVLFSILSKILHIPYIEFHCIIHQQVLCAKQGLKTFSNVMPVVIKAINFINARALNKRQFAQLLEEIECQYSGILTYNNVRWLSCGQVLNFF